MPVLFLFNPHTNSVPFEGKRRISNLKMDVPGRMNSIYRGKGFGEDRSIGSKGHPKRRSIYVKVQERERV